MFKGEKCKKIDTESSVASESVSPNHCEISCLAADHIQSQNVIRSFLDKLMHPAVIHHLNEYIECLAFQEAKAQEMSL